MKIDWGRLIIFWVGLYLSQIVISIVLATIGVPVGSMAFLILFNLILGFVFAYFYQPSYARQGLFRNPDYYKNSLMFFIVLFLLDVFLW